MSKVFSVLRFFIRPARVWVISYCVTAVLELTNNLKMENLKIKLRNELTVIVSFLCHLIIQGPYVPTGNKRGRKRIHPDTVSSHLC